MVNAWRPPRLLLVLLAAACAKDLSELEPYPCPSAYPRCPEGRACVPGVGCTLPFLDAPCNDFTECALGVPDGVCVGGPCTFDDIYVSCETGSCATPCGAAGECAAGRTCVAGVCLADCSAGEACADGLACRAVPAAAGQRACQPPGLVLPTCASVAVTSTCQRCGIDYWTIPCGGDWCPVSSSCSADGMYCMCDPDLFVFTCENTTCTDCTYPNWWCRPTSITETPGCDDTTFAAAGACVCADGRELAFDCGELPTCEQRCAAP